MRAILLLLFSVDFVHDLCSHLRDDALMSGELIVAVIAASAGSVTAHFIGFVALTGMEVILPRSAVSWFSRLRSAAYWIVALPLWALVGLALGKLWPTIGSEPIISIDLTALNFFVVVLLVNIVGDFFFYWQHRLQHRLFWRFHATHHSIRELSAVNSYHHVSEIFFQLALSAGPFLFIFGGPFVAAAAGVGGVVSFFIHANTKITLGPLRYIIIDPPFHRIHHSTNPEHFGKNFGGFTPLWDVVFGTAYFPRKDEWPETGLVDFPEPDGLVDWLMAPWRPKPHTEEHPSSQAV